MKTKLSYSQVSRYTQCGESYRLYYKEKLRPKYTTGALIFGSALDQAINEILEGKGNGYEIFKKAFTFAKINKKDEFIPTSELVVYANSDFDLDLLDSSDFRHLENKFGKGDFISEFKRLKEKKSINGFDNFSLEEKQLYNFMNWLSMEKKGYLMLDAYITKVMPRIKKVIAIQKPINLKNQVGDEITGFIDVIAELDDHGPVVLDNKTSSMPYDKDSVLTSAQLSLYLHEVEDEIKTRKAGYIVLNKNVKKNKEKTCSFCGFESNTTHKTCNNTIDGKRCGREWKEKITPEIDIQIIVDEIPKRTEEIVLENMDAANNGIKHEIFTRNFNMCKNYYGGNCPYLDVCYHNRIDKLVKG